ncbi:MAG: hypothetical protein ACE5F9_04550 [Phycisphaerae bacterium]
MSRWIAVCAVLWSVAGCASGGRSVRDVDPDRAAGFVIALGMAGFDGDVSIEGHGEVEFGLKQAAYARSPGTHLTARGHLNPAAVTPATVRAYLDALKRLKPASAPGANAPGGPIE